MEPHIEIAYVGVEASDPVALATFLTEVVGLVRGDATADGYATFRDDGAAHRLLVREGPADDGVLAGFEVPDAAAFDATVARLAAAGFDATPGTEAERAARRVADLASVTAPWGVRIEVVWGLERPGGFSSPLVPGGFLTEGMGFGHGVFATDRLDEAHRLATDGLGLRQSDWIETELAPGIPLEVRFYHGNARHHSLALARLPFPPPKALHHVMFETNHLDDTGRALDRAMAAGHPIANRLGRHDNDEMTSFYVVSPTGFQVEVGHGARVVTEPWTENRQYSDISRWGHQPLPA